MLNNSLNGVIRVINSPTMLRDVLLNVKKYNSQLFKFTDFFTKVNILDDNELNDLYEYVKNKSSDTACTSVSDRLLNREYFVRVVIGYMGYKRYGY